MWERNLVALCSLFSTWFPRVSCNLLMIWAEISTLVVVGKLNAVLGSICAVWTTLLYGLSTYSYFKLIVVGAGSPRQSMEFLQDEESGVPECIRQSVLAKNNGKPRYCNKCLCWKPDRTHHCRTCRQCILKMDHHCPWFSTCIGFKNYKYFVQLLWYIVLFCFSCSFVSIWDLMHWFDNENYENEYVSINEILLAIISSVFGGVLFLFTGYTTYLLVTNTTTLEAMDGSVLRTSLPTSQYRYRPAPTLDNVGNIFDMGWKENCNQVLGSTWREWLLPIQPLLPDGFDGSRFPVKEHLLDLAESRAQAEIAMHARKPLVRPETLS